MAVSEDRRESYYHLKMREAALHYEGYDILSGELALNLIHTYDVFLQRSARYMGEFGLSKSTVNILMLLQHGPREGMQLHDLGELLLVSRANITGLIDHLEEKGYVKRFIDAHDRRARFARITAKGQSLLDEFMPIHIVNVKAMLQDLADEEKRSLVHLLKKMRGSMAAREQSLDTNTVEYSAENR